MPESTKTRDWPIVLSVFLAIAVVGGGLAGWVRWSRRSQEGVTLTYAIDPAEAMKLNPAQIGKGVGDVLFRRLERLGAAEVKCEFLDRTAEQPDRVTITITGIDPARVPDYRRLLALMGRLELCGVASEPVQLRFSKDRVVPVGFRPVDNPNPFQRAEYSTWSGSQILVEQASVIAPRHIIASEARQSLDSVGSSQWVTTFELDAEGARLFDEAAKILFNMKPRGMIAILLDGRLRSAPVIMSDHFDGHGQISGAKSEQEAKDLAITLQSGPLPARLGRMKGGVFVPGEPEAERRFGPGK
jgi:preprotein translocase subunit SecD